MLTYRFDNENDATATVNALRVAAERFIEHATHLKKEHPQQDRLARQFNDQATQARRIADEMEQIVG